MKAYHNILEVILSLQTFLLEHGGYWYYTFIFIFYSFSAKVAPFCVFVSILCHYVLQYDACFFR